MHTWLYREKHKAPPTHTHTQYSNFPNVSPPLITQNCIILSGLEKQKPNEIRFVLCAWVCVYICMCDMCVWWVHAYVCSCVCLYGYAVARGNYVVPCCILPHFSFCLIPWRYSISLILVLGWWPISPRYPSVSGLHSRETIVVCVHSQNLKAH